MILDFDDDQKKAIHSLANTVVVAGAGSGKTSVLAERFVWLLKTQDVTVDQILSLTFTNKAAAEMQEKIYAALSRAHDDKLIAARTNFHKAEISTIDSFSAKIARNACHLFGLPPDFSIDDETLQNNAQTMAFDFLLSHAGTTSVRTFLNKYGFQAFCRELLGRIAREQLSIAQDTDFCAIVGQQYAKMESVLPKHLAELFETTGQLLNNFTKPFTTIIQNRPALLAIEQLEALITGGKNREAQQILDAVHLRASNAKPTDETIRLKDLIEHFRQRRLRLTDIIQARLERGAIEDLARLLSQFQEAFNDHKRQTKTVSFRDVAAMAVKALLLSPALRRFYKEKFRFIMIDEFQDNNHLQKELLFFLAEKKGLSLDRVPRADELENGKLFFVGDEKQSIYAFRGAEVNVFKRLKDELGAQGGSVLLFRNNYRSAPGLIAFFNRVFSSVLGDATADFEANFEALEAKGQAGSAQPSVRLFFKQYSGDSEETDLSAHESEAWTIAEWIYEQVTTQALLIRQDGENRPATWQDFALLMRSTGNQIIFERMFRKRGVPYVTQNLRSLFTEPPVNDLYALLACAHNPDDRIAYATLLRSPFVRVSDGALISILREKAPPFSPLRLDPDDEARYTTGRKRYEHIQDRLDREPLSRLIFHAWYNFGYRYHILQNPAALLYLEYFDHFFSLAVKAEARGESAGRFLAWVGGNLGRFEKIDELESATRTRDCVQMMSIHKAKGLEFPVVIAANLGNRGRTREKNSPVFFSKEFGPVINLGGSRYFSALSGAEETAREQAELKRLFYVALTRARSHLVLSGVFTKQNRTNPNSNHLAMLFSALRMNEKDWNNFYADDYTGEVTQIPDLPREVLRTERADVQNRTLHAATNAYQATPVARRSWRQRQFTVSELNDAFLATGTGDTQTELLTLPALETDGLLKTDEAHAQWGTLTHFILNQKLHGSYSRLALPLSQTSSFEQKHLSGLIAQAEAVCDRFLDSKTGRRCVSAARRESEFPFLYRATVGEKTFLVHGTIDLFYTTKNSAVVIDFKTDRHLRQADYAAQLAIYQAVITEYVQLPTTAYLYSLRSQELYPLEAGFDISRIFR